MAIKKVRGNPISGGAANFRPTPPVLTDAAQPSRTAQRMIKQPPANFGNPNGIASLPAGTNPNYRANANFAKDALRYGGVPKSVSVHKKPTVDWASVGYKKPSNLGVNSVNSGFPTGAQRVAGRISTNAGPQANAKEMRRLKQTYPGLGIGKWRP